MPRRARLDAPGLIHHVMVRGIERRDIFADDDDRYVFLKRLAKLAGGEKNQLFAFALMPNHVHMLIRTLEMPLSICMRRLLTGYAVYFNKHHKRCGHLFQNRYKSIVVDEDTYLLELIRYIHLNPIRAGIHQDLNELSRWPFSGHAALMGNASITWFDSASTLALFDGSFTHARTRLTHFMQAGLTEGNIDYLCGGGLKRSLTSLATSERTQMLAYDERILGCGDFVEGVLGALDRSEECASEHKLDELLQKVAVHFDVSLSELCSSTKRRAAVRAKAAVIWLGVRYCGFSAAELARALSISTTRIYETLNSGRGESEGSGITHLLI